MNYQLVRQMNGFRVYILEGDPSFKPGDRQLSAPSRRTWPPPHCPIKRKRPAEPCGIGQSLEARHAAARLSLGPSGADPIQGTVASSHRDYSPVTPDPIPDQPLALIKKRPLGNRPTSDLSRPLQSTVLQQMRPSVITCAPPNACNGGQDRLTEREGATLSYCTGTEGAARPVSCDSVVDEHFRRSLGWDYGARGLAPNSLSISSSVDEHFSQSLGEQWQWLQAGGDSEAAPRGADGAPSQESTGLPPIQERSPIARSSGQPFSTHLKPRLAQSRDS